MATHRPAKQIIGWREWVALPHLGVPLLVKAKVDTGARSSTLHAFGMQIYTHEQTKRVRFEVHPKQRSRQGSILADMPLIAERWVRSSDGRRELRPVIETAVQLAGFCWPIEITLTNRDQMGFRMLLGRQAVRRRFLVDSGKSFLAGGSSDTAADHDHDHDHDGGALPQRTHAHGR